MRNYKVCLVELESLPEMIFEVESLAELEALLISLRPVGRG